MERPHTSIVILVRNELEFTRACVESIARHTPEPHELVFVDNGSTDATPAYLASLDGAIVIRNEDNLGFGGGCNQGIAAAVGERILLLNNDVVVTEGWLAAMHDALDADPGLGIVGPRSNRAAGQQQVDDVGYDVNGLDGLDTWASAWRAKHAGDVQPTMRLIGFCMLMERAVVDRIGGFDLRYGIGNLEDDDLCLRAAIAGFGCAIANGSFIHHAGSRTFTAERIDYRATLAQNLARFTTKWGMGEGDVDRTTGSYRSDRVIARTPWNPRLHHAPLVATPSDLARIELVGARSTVVAVCCDRLDLDATAHSLRAVLAAFGPDDDATVVVRIDPRDDESPALLDAVADIVGDAALPDVVVLDAADDNDEALLSRADLVVVHGRFAAARALLARHVGTPTATIDDLARARSAAA